MAIDFLGFGLTRPFRRDKKTDFASAGGADLVKSSVGQILGTRAQSELSPGEIPWRPEFGSLLHMLRHVKNKAVLQDLARVHVNDALARWAPRTIVREVTAERFLKGRGLLVRVVFDLIDENVPGNNVILGGLVVEVAV